MTFASDMDIDYVFCITIKTPPLYPGLNNPVEHFFYFLFERKTSLDEITW